MRQEHRFGKKRKGNFAFEFYLVEKYVWDYTISGLENVFFRQFSIPEEKYGRTKRRFPKPSAKRPA
jgi:hypothetical protein